jgi:hypothetical protein
MDKFSRPDYRELIPDSCSIATHGPLPPARGESIAQGSLTAPFGFVRPAGRIYLEVQVLYTPGKGG